MNVEYLISLGLTPTESKVYLEIAKFNETEIGKIIKITGLHRGSVYNAIEDLIKKGFISFLDRQGHRYYKISGKKIFENIIEEKISTAENLQKKLSNLFEEIERKKPENSNQEVEVFYGISSFKNLFLEIYDECKKRDIEYLFQGMGGEMQDATGEAFYKYTQKLKKKLKVKCRVILDKATLKHSYHKHVKGNIRYLSSKINSPINFWIYGDNVLIVIFGATPLVSIKIKSKLLSDGFTSYFEELWKIAK